MRLQKTSYQRAIQHAKGLKPAAKQIGNSLMFDVDSTSKPDTFHHVYLGANKLNPLLDATCECTDRRFKICVHRAAAFLLYTSNLEARLEKGYTYLHSGKVQGKDYDDFVELWEDLLTRYEKCIDLSRAIEQGFDISQLTEPFKHRLATSFDSILLSA